MFRCLTHLKRKKKTRYEGCRGIWSHAWKSYLPIYTRKLCFCQAFEDRSGLTLLALFPGPLLYTPKLTSINLKRQDERKRERKGEKIKNRPRTKIRFLSQSRPAFFLFPDLRSQMEKAERNNDCKIECRNKKGKDVTQDRVNQTKCTILFHAQHVQWFYFSLNGLEAKSKKVTTIRNQENEQ